MDKLRFAQNVMRILSKKKRSMKQVEDAPETTK